MTTQLDIQVLKTLDGSLRPIGVAIHHNGDLENGCYLYITSGGVSMSVGPIGGKDLSGSLLSLATSLSEALEAGPPLRRTAKFGSS